MNNLANAYSYRIHGDRAENTECAIDAHQQALLVMTREDMPVEWAQTTHNLAVAFSSRGKGDREENLKRAIELYQQALQVRTRQAMPVKWATTMMNLASIYGDPHRVWGDRAEDVDRAIETYRQALEVFRPESLPTDCRRAARNLGYLYSEKKDWHSGYEAYATAIRAAEMLYRSAFIPTNKKAEIEVNVALYDSMVSTCLQLRDAPQYMRDALIFAEGGKTRTFLDEMGQTDFPAPSGAPSHSLDRERELITQLRQVQQASREPRLFDVQERALATQLKALRDELEGVWDVLVDECPETQEYVSLRRAQSPTWDDLTRLASRIGPQAALVEFHVGNKEVAAFVLRDGWDAPEVFVLPISYEQLSHRYFEAFQEEVVNRSPRQPPHSWLNLGEELLTPLELALAEVQLVYLIPHNLLHHLPLHALTVKGEPFIARHAIAYAPSMAVLARVLERASGRKEDDTALAVCRSETLYKAFMW